MFYDYLFLQNEEMQQQIIKETFQLVSKRDDNVCNFLEGGRYDIMLCLIYFLQSNNMQYTIFYTSEGVGHARYPPVITCMMAHFSILSHYDAHTLSFCISLTLASQ